MAEHGRVAGKVVIVSGSAKGMGAAHVALLAREGALIIAGDMDDDAGAREAEVAGADYVHLDVTSPEDWDAAVTHALDRHGRVDVLINNAGLVVGSGVDVENYDLELFRRVMDVNYYGVLHGMRAVLPSMKQAGRGSIVNIASIAGLAGWYRSAAYCSSKYAVTGLTKTVALEAGRSGVRVNSVHPGLIETPLTSSREFVTEHVAMNRVGQPDEISQVVLFLASDESSFSTGAAYVVDGGESAGRPMANYR